MARAALRSSRARSTCSASPFLWGSRIPLANWGLDSGGGLVGPGGRCEPALLQTLRYGEPRSRLSRRLATVHHAIEPSRRSRTGKDISLSVDVTVTKNSERLEIFRLLPEHPDSVYVL